MIQRVLKGSIICGPYILVMYITVPFFYRCLFWC